MPTKTSLKNAVKDAELYIVAMLVDKQKHIVNAAKAAITVADPSGIENTMQKGINIIRMANGKTIKMVQK